MTLPDDIRQTVAPAHDAVEQTGFARAMVSGRITRDEYVVGLNELAHLHAALEANIEAVRPDCPELAGLYDPATTARTPLLDRDLSAFGSARTATAGSVVARLADRFAVWQRESPWALLGPLYITEGSRMGSMFLAKSLAKAFGLVPTDGVGLDYHVHGMATRPADWKRFRATLADLSMGEGKHADVVRAADETMDAIVAMYAGLPVAMPEPAGV